MDADMIIVFGLALVFFGGISYLLWKERNSREPQTANVKSILKEARQQTGKPHKGRS